MPRPPRCVTDIDSIASAIYSPFSEPGADGVRAFPLHVGDTWLEPFQGARMEDLRTKDHPGLNRYTTPRGIPDLVDAIVEKTREKNRLRCERDSVWVTGGATGGLAAAVGALVAPGEEVLLLAPFWPLIPGIVRTFRARPVEVPFYDRVDSPESAVEAAREQITPRTVALYVSTPSNPTGRLLPGAWLAALAELARREGLWLFSDEVYEEIVYRGKHVSIGEYAPERTVTAFSLSKAYGMAGNRTGYLVGPPETIGQIGKVSTHTVYCAPAAGQVAALRALREGGPWLARARSLYREAGEDAARVLGLPLPEGSNFLFLDVRRLLDERGLPAFLDACYRDGVLVAPGGPSRRRRPPRPSVASPVASPPRPEERPQLREPRAGRISAARRSSVARSTGSGARGRRRPKPSPRERGRTCRCT
jgi:aspartate/methionine/tyrosine aminotransferase